MKILFKWFKYAPKDRLKYFKLSCKIQLVQLYNEVIND